MRSATGYQQAGYRQALRDRQLLRNEILAGLTTFLTMAYIVLVNPTILGDAGMDSGAVFTATCLAAAIGSLMMGLIADYPIALAPSMGLNVYFSYVVVQSLGFTWQVALAAVFCSGVLFFLLTLMRLRQWVMAAIPPTLKIAISVGIGLFLGLIAFKNIGLAVIVPNKLPHFAFNLQPEMGLFLLGFLLILGLERLHVPGGILLGIIVTACLGHWFKLNPFYGIMALPPSIKPTLLQLNIQALLQPGLISVVLTFFIVALLDNTATLVGLAHLAGFIDKKGKIPRLTKVFIADSSATMIGSCLGTSTVGSYVESAAGIRAGGRTGLTSIVVALLFLGALFFSPLAKTIPSYATAPALMFVAILMSRSLKHIPWWDISEWLPSIITALAIPLNFSIAKGVSYGFISYVISKICCLKIRDISLSTLILTVLLVGYLFL